MIRRDVRRALGAATLALLGAAGCAAPDSTVHVVVNGEARDVFQLEVDVRVGGFARTLDVPRTPQRVVLPTSFTVQVPDEFSGELRMTIVAKNDRAQPTWRGQARLPALEVGRRNDLLVRLDENQSAPPAAPPSTAP
jgi:hypothetical protein